MWSEPCPRSTPGPSSPPSPTLFTSANSTTQMLSHGKQLRLSKASRSPSPQDQRQRHLRVWKSLPASDAHRDALRTGSGEQHVHFPGIGLGAILSRTHHVSDAMVEQAAVALASSLNAEEQGAGLVYSRLGRICELSGRIALGVIRQAQTEVRCVVRWGYSSRD